MVATFESGFKTTLALRLDPTDTTMTVATAPTRTSGRLYLKSGSQKEWISFTGVSGNTITWLTRWLSQTADPATAWTGLTWIAGTKIVLVAMHDQLPDKQQPTTFAAITVTGDSNFNGTLRVPVYATTADRDIAIPSPTNGMIVYVTAWWVLYQYIAGAWTTFATGTTPNASDTVAGKIEIATYAEFIASTNVWGTGAFLSVLPWDIVTYIAAQIKSKNWSNYQISQNNFTL